MNGSANIDVYINAAVPYFQREEPPIVTENRVTIACFELPPPLALPPLSFGRVSRGLAHSV